MYRGKAVPTLAGKYVFADLVDGRVMYAEEREMHRAPGARRATIHELRVFDLTGRALTMPDAAGDNPVRVRFRHLTSGELVGSD